MESHFIMIQDVAKIDGNIDKDTLNLYRIVYVELVPA